MSLTKDYGLCKCDDRVRLIEIVQFDDCRTFRCLIRTLAAWLRFLIDLSLFGSELNGLT